MIFWFAVAAMVMLAIACIAVPLWRQPGPGADDGGTSDQLRRFEELEADLEAGDLDADTAPLVRGELERAVVDAVAEATAPPAARTGRLVPIAIAVIGPLLAVAIYSQIGRPGIAKFAGDHPELNLSEPKVAVEILLEQVRARVASEPADIEAWTVLARTNLKLGRFDEAVAAAERVAALAPDDSDGLLLLTDAVAMQAGGALVPRAVELIDHVLARDGDNVTALVLKGIAHEQRGDHDAALDHWRRALGLLPDDAPMRGDLEAMVSNSAADAGPAPTLGAQSDDARVTATVTLAPELMQGLDDAATVFVIARAENGPRIPLAVARHRVDELPLTVTLDDSMAMVPGASLGDFSQVYVVARVALSDQPRAESGDFEGRSVPFTPAADSRVSVVIDSVVP